MRFLLNQSTQSLHTYTLSKKKKKNPQQHFLLHPPQLISQQKLTFLLIVYICFLFLYKRTGYSQSEKERRSPPWVMAVDEWGCWLSPERKGCRSHRRRSWLQNCCRGHWSQTANPKKQRIIISISCFSPLTEERGDVWTISWPLNNAVVALQLLHQNFHFLLQMVHPGIEACGVIQRTEQTSIVRESAPTDGAFHCTSKLRFVTRRVVISDQRNWKKADHAELAIKYGRPLYQHWVRMVLYAVY